MKTNVITLPPVPQKPAPQETEAYRCLGCGSPDCNWDCEPELREARDAIDRVISRIEAQTRAEATPESEVAV